MGHIKYPKIGQLKDTIYEVRRRATFAGLDDDEQPIYDSLAELPTLKFEGTVKLHGSNASVVIDGDEVRFQSRNRVITPESDNMGFATWASEYDWKSIFSAYDEQLLEAGPLVIYGEWIGEGIQRGVAVSELTRRFVIFNIQFDGRWLSSDWIVPFNFPDGIESVYDANYAHFVIDFKEPQQAQNSLIELTEEVEAECPYGNLHGIKGIGEGIVWKCITPGWEDLWFKVKGERHSKSKVKTLSAVDLDMLNKANALAAEIMTIERMNQGVDHIKEMGLKIVKPSLGHYLKYVVSDAIAESAIAIEEAGIETKALGKPLSEIAKNYFLTLEREL